MPSSHARGDTLVRSNITACLRCRQRKQKCDQSLPNCRSCEKAGVDCVGYDAVAKRHVPRSYVHSLEERIAFLELKLQRHGIAGLDSDTCPQQHPVSTSQACSPAAASSQLPPPVASSQEPEGILDRLVEEKAKDQVGSFSQLLRLGPHNDSSFNRLLFAELHKVEAILDLSQAWEESGEARDDSYFRFEVPKNLDPSSASLPEKRLAEYLTKVYFEFANFSSPVLHEPSFRRKLEVAYTMQASNREIQQLNRPSRLAFLFSYMMLAIALLTLQKHDSARVPTSLCERYYYAALGCVDSTGLPHDIEGVQILLLIVQYYYMHPHPFDTWKTVGLALRLAVELGFNQDPPAGKLDPLTLDTRRRVFWVAYSMDRTVGTVMGRPFCLSDGAIDVQLPSPVDDDLITSEGILDDANRPLGKKAFSLQYFRYRQLQSEIHTTLWERNPPAYLSIDFYAWQQDMHERLRKWLSSTPQDAAPSNIAPPDVLELAYSQAVISLYRPSPQIPTPSEMAMAHLAESASHFIRLYRRLHRENKLRLFWLATQNLFGAGTALLYAYSHSSEVRERISYRALESDTRGCSSVLWAMVERFPAAKGKRDAFDMISSSVLDSILSTMSNLPSSVSNNSEQGSLISDRSPRTNFRSHEIAASSPAIQQLTIPRDASLHATGLGEYREAPTQVGRAVSMPFSTAMEGSTADLIMNWTNWTGEGLGEADLLSLNADVLPGEGDMAWSGWV